MIEWRSVSERKPRVLSSIWRKRGQKQTAHHVSSGMVVALGATCMGFQMMQVSQSSLLKDCFFSIRNTKQTPLTHSVVSPFDKSGEGIQGVAAPTTNTAGAGAGAGSGAGWTPQQVKE
jgi:hypothetical protein